MANLYKNKVVYGGTTLIDITDTTATASDVASGKVFYTADGAQTVGTGTSSGGDNDVVITLTQNQSGTWIPDKTYAEIDAAYNGGKTVSWKTYDNSSGVIGWYDSGFGGYYYLVEEFVDDGNDPIIYDHAHVIVSDGSVSDLGRSGTYYSTTNATATASDVANGKVFFNASGKQTGTASGGGGAAIAITDTTDTAGGTIREITAVDLSSDTVTAARLLSGYTAHDSSGNAITGTYVAPTYTSQAKTGITPSTSSQTITPDSGYDGLSYVQIDAMPSGSATTPATTITANPSISVNSSGLITATASTSQSVTPTVSAGYVSSGTAGTITVSGSNTEQLTTQAATTITPTTSSQVAVAAGRYTTGAVTVAAIPSQYIVPSGTLSITENGTVDVTDYASATVNVSGGSVSYDTKTVTASNYPVSLSFTGMSGEPKAFVVRLNASVSSSGSTSYYYIVEIAAFGTTTHGNCFRIGSTRRVDTITSGYSWSYSGTTLTITSSASSRSSSPGAFYSGSYELLYIY